MQQRHLCVLECPNNATLSHNASSSQPSGSNLHFTSSTAIRFECKFVTRFLSINQYTWYVDRVDMNVMSKYFTYYFAAGVHQVMCTAWYQVPSCETCISTVPVTVTILGKIAYSNSSCNLVIDVSLPSRSQGWPLHSRSFSGVFHHRCISADWRHPTRDGHWSPSSAFSCRQDMLRPTDTQQFRRSKLQCCRPACVEQFATAPTTRHELRAFPV